MRWQISAARFDRIFMVTEPDGTFITARQFPKWYVLPPLLIHQRRPLHLTAPDGSSAGSFYGFHPAGCADRGLGETIYRSRRPDGD